MAATGGADRGWYEAGLRFECTGCGRCCTGGSGYVWVSVEEATMLASALSLDLDDFGRRYLRRIGERYALLEAGAEGACVFLDGTRCSVYDARPGQCRSYPFWASNLESAAAWARAAAVCEGIRDDAALVGREAIETLRRG